MLIRYLNSGATATHKTKTVKNTIKELGRKLLTLAPCNYYWFSLMKHFDWWLNSTLIPRICWEEIAEDILRLNSSATAAHKAKTVKNTIKELGWKLLILATSNYYWFSLMKHFDWWLNSTLIRRRMMNIGWLIGLLQMLSIYCI